MKRYLILVIAAVVFVASCQEKEEGCTHPLAINFDPEADELTSCDFYELQLEMQHVHTVANDTFLLGDTLYDVLDTAFILNSFSILCSEATLIQTAQSTRMTGAENLTVKRTDGSTTTVEDNFFIISPEIYSYNVSEWNVLGNFDSVRFYIGANPTLFQADPSSVTESNHPLSSTSVPYLYNADSMAYMALNIEINQFNSGITKTIQLIDFFSLNYAYAGAVVDNQNTILRLRLNYDSLFNNISVFNDSEMLIQSKLIQNIPSALSTF